MKYVFFFNEAFPIPGESLFNDVKATLRKPIKGNIDVVGKHMQTGVAAGRRLRKQRSEVISRLFYFLSNNSVVFTFNLLDAMRKINTKLNGKDKLTPYSEKNNY